MYAKQPSIIIVNTAIFLMETEFNKIMDFHENVKTIQLLVSKRKNKFDKSENYITTWEKILIGFSTYIFYSIYQIKKHKNLGDVNF